MGVLVRVERGADPDVVEFISADGSVLLARAWGVSPDERLRTREALLRLLAPVVAAVTRGAR